MQTDNQGGRRRAVYGLTALATTGVLTLPGTAHAGVHVFSSGLTTSESSTFSDDDGRDIFFSFNAGLSSTNLSQLPGSSYDFRLKNYFLASTNANFALVTPGASGNYWLADNVGLGYPLRLGVGNTIGPSGLLGTAPTLADNIYGYGNWNDFGRGYIGLSFQMNDGTHYGWADVVVKSDYNIQLVRFGYEDQVDTAIVTPQFAGPEPNALELLALGFPAMGLYRLRQKKQAERNKSLDA